MYDNLKELSRAVMGKCFIDKPLDKYLYMSLTQPPLKIIDKQVKTHYIVQCPNCQSKARYVSEVFKRLYIL